MSLQDFARGVSFGILTLLFVQVVLIYFGLQYLKHNRVVTIEEKPSGQPVNIERVSKESTLPFPQPVVDYLKRRKSVEAERTVDFLNLLLHRMFLTWRSSDKFRQLWGDKMSRKINRKLQDNSYISSLKIVDLIFGDYPPVIKAFKSSVLDDLALSLDVDLVYRGGVVIEIETTLANGNVIPLKVVMNEFKGTIHALVPSLRWPDMYGFQFTDDPGVTFSVDFPLMAGYNDMFRGIVNRILSTLMRRTFLDMWVAPSWRTNYLPLLEPPRDAYYERQEMDKALDAAAKKQKVGIATKATQLWESTAPLLKRSAGKYKDGLSEQLFATDTPIPLYDTFRLPLYKDPLQKSFLALINEPTDARSKKKLTDIIRPSSDDLDEANGSGEDIADNQNTWKVVRSKSNIQVHRKRVSDGDGVAEYLRGIIPVSCDAARVFGILSNVKHFMHVYENYTESKTLIDNNDCTINQVTFTFQKEIKHMRVFQIQGTHEENEKESFTVVFRSAGGFAYLSESLSEGNTSKGWDTSFDDTTTSPTDDSVSTPAPVITTVLFNENEKSASSSEETKTENDGKVYLFGYKITAVDENSCEVSVLSHFSTEFQKLDVDYNFCRKLKQFIEELTELTDLDPHRESTPDSKKGNESPDLRMRDKIANYIGNRASVLLKGKKSTTTRDFEVVDKSPIDRPILNQATNAFVSSMSLISAFGQEPMIEKFVDVKEICTVEIPFNRSAFGDHVVLRWEYACHSEGPPYFGINYVPESLDMPPMVKLLPFNGTGSRVLFPLCHVQSYSKPAYGTIPVSTLKSGKFVFIWDNTIAFSKRSPKTFSYRVLVENANQQHSCHCQIDIPRKTAISMPVVHEMESNVAGKIEYFSGSTNIPFAVYFDMLSGVKPLPRQASSDGEKQWNFDVLSPGQTRKTLVSFNKVPSKGNGLPVKESLDLNKGAGVLTLIWDNTQSLVSTRHVEIHLDIVPQQ